jgi:hypothetical protein
MKVQARLLLALVIMAAFVMPAFAAQAPLTKAEKAASIADLQASLVRADAGIASEQATLDSLLDLEAQTGSQVWLTRAIADAEWWVAYYQRSDARIRYVLQARGA